MNLKAYLRTMKHDQRVDFAARCGCTLQHLKFVAYKAKTCSDALALAIERESDCRVTVSDLRPEFAKALKISGYRKTKNDLGCQCQHPDMNTS